MRDDRDARLDAIVQRHRDGLISYASMTEAVLFSDEHADDQRRRANGIA